MVLRRTELPVIGLHRHFLSELTYTCAGVESLVLSSVGDGSRFDDEADRIYYRGCGDAASNLAASRRALASNARSGRPVRVLRVASVNASAMALRILLN